MRATITTILCILCFTAGLALSPNKTIAQPFPVIVHVPVYQSVHAGKYFGAQRDRLAAAIPLSALRRK